MRFDVTDVQGAIHKMDTDKFESKFLNIDCMEVLRKMPDKCIDLCICDPPYAVGASDGLFGGKRANPSKVGGKTNGRHYANHDKTPDGQYFAELFRVSRNQVVWGANYYPQHFHHSGWVVWDKLTVGPLSDCELAYQSINKLVKKYTCNWSGAVKVDGGKMVLDRIHPNQKPIALYKWLLSNYAKPGDKILDTHVGSASSLIACHQLGYEYWGFELDTDYYNAATERLNKAKAQVSMMELIEQVEQQTLA